MAEAYNKVVWVGV